MAAARRPEECTYARKPTKRQMPTSSLGGNFSKEWTVIGLEGVKPIPGMSVMVPKEGVKGLS
jgi:hypothetical protein